MRPLTIFIVLVAVLAGCGTSDEERVRATIAAEVRAYARQDWNAVCKLRTAAGRREVVLWSPGTPAAMCAGAWTPARGGDETIVFDNEPIITFRLKPSRRRLIGVDVSDDVAHARYDDGSVRRLRKVGGRWLIDAELVRRPR